VPSAGDYVRASDVPGDVGCQLRRVANQSITNGVATAISWDTEDVDTNGFIAVTSSTITIPAGLGGLYAITAYLNCAGITGTGGAIIIDPTSSITGMPADFLTPLDETRDRGSFGIIIPLLAGDTFNVQAFHASAAAVNFTAWLSCYRIAVL